MSATVGAPAGAPSTLHSIGSVHPIATEAEHVEVTVISSGQARLARSEYLPHRRALRVAYATEGGLS
jgi:hypothetical protein